MKQKCDCGNIATWLYMPSSSSKENPFYCDDCVPRGCSCNNTSLEEDYAQQVMEENDKNGYDKTQRKPTHFSRWMNLVNNFV